MLLIIVIIYICKYMSRIIVLDCLTWHYVFDSDIFFIDYGNDVVAPL